MAATKSNATIVAIQYVNVSNIITFFLYVLEG